MKIFTCRFLLATVLGSQLFFTANAQNTAILFDGIDGYASIEQPIATGSSYTKEAWVYATNTAGSHNIISSMATPFWIKTNHLRAGQAGDYYLVSDPAVFPSNQWVHVAVTYDDATQTMKLYKNGKLVATNSSVPAYTSELTFIGCHKDGASLFAGKIDEVRIWDVARSAEEIKRGMLGTVSSGSPGLIAWYDMNEGTGTTFNNVAAGSGADGTLINSPSWVSSPVEYDRNALNFDGVDDYVKVPANAALDFAIGTIECWVRPENLSGNACIICNRGTGFTARWSFHMSDTDDQIGFWNNSAYLTLPYTISSGQWYHLAFVYDGTDVTLYVNGDLVGVINQSFSGVTGQPVYIGITGDLGEFFDGDIDEVRIWNTVRTQTEIQTYKDVALTGTESGLVALYDFDQGISDGDNTGLITAIDNTNNNLHGQLVNFSLNGTSSNWNAHTEIIPLPVRLVYFNAKKRNNSTLLHWQTASEQNSREFVIEKSNDGTDFRIIGSIAAAGNSSQARNYSFIDKNPASGNNYYRLRQVDLDGSFRYSSIVRVDFAHTQKLSWYATGNRTVEVRLQSGGNERYSLRDMNGRTILKGKLSGGKVRLPQLAAGSYSVQVQTASGNVQSMIVIR